ncbi:hypothetical protein TA3x_001977 [Tundrisphaera sp. TA3]|uniref:hypothetical protein n=1 Tax=Tundrisphaera sp. TA3 TaxID=3435775 RepID=UPI003EBE753E
MNVEAAILNLINEVRLIRGHVEDLVNRQPVKDFYSTEEFAKLKGMKPKTVRDNLNAGRLLGIKRRDGQGRSQKWAIPHAEADRYDREGLLPARK